MKMNADTTPCHKLAHWQCYWTDSLLHWYPATLPPCRRGKAPAPKCSRHWERKWVVSPTQHNKARVPSPSFGRTFFFFGAAQEVHWTWWKFGRSPEPTTSYQRPSLTPRNHFISFVVGWCFGAVQKCLDCYYSCPTGTWPNRLVILIWSMLGNASIHLFEPADQKWRN